MADSIIQARCQNCGNYSARVCKKWFVIYYPATAGMPAKTISSQGMVHSLLCRKLHSDSACKDSADCASQFFHSH